MHEFTITQNLLNRALKTANSKRIVRINLLIGPFSEEREDAIQFFWRDLAKGSFGEDAKLHFDHVKPEMMCLGCTGTFHLDENEKASTCKYCYSDHLQLLEDDVLLESIEVE